MTAPSVSERLRELANSGMGEDTWERLEALARPRMKPVLIVLTRRPRMARQRRRREGARSGRNNQYNHKETTTMTTTEISKPRWVECADKAAIVLDVARSSSAEERDAIVREADAWMRLACVYRDGRVLES